MWPPHLLMSRSPAQRVVLVGVVPALFGALTGWLLGESEPAYLIANLVAAIGGFLAGLEHERAGEAAARGAIAGLLFGAFIVIVHEITGEAEAHLPDPPIVLAVITSVAGAILAVLGALLRRRLVPRSADEPPSQSDLR